MKKTEFKLRGERAGRRLEITLIASVLGLALFGVVMIYSASSYSATKDYGDSLYFAKRQLLGCAAGIAGMVLLSFVDYRKLMKLRWIALAVSVVLLAIIFIPHVGVENYGARRWIKLFGGFTLQPSEIAKFGFILFSAAYMAKHRDKMVQFKGLLPVILAGVTICLLIILEPNMSITICVALLMLAMLFVGGMQLKHFLVLAVPMLVAVPVLILMEPYRLARLMAFLDPWASPKGEGYQLIQSLYALGNGGLFGVGLGNSRQKLDFLPFAESDFIFSIIGEELGFFGSMLILAVFAVVILCGIKIALNAKDRFGTYLASGVTAIIAIQVIINVAVVTGSIPPTGLPLPFISYGSTAQMVFLSAVGVLININRDRRRSSILHG